MINKGIDTKRAAKKMTNPTTLLNRPPTRGIYPRMVVMGEKNMQIETTISTNETSLMILVNNLA
jgi:hypothetical protein